MANDPIVKRLLGTKSKIIFEADEDNDGVQDEEGTEYDDSQAPNVSPEEAEEINPDPDEEGSESDEPSPDGGDAPSHSMPSSSSPSNPSMDEPESEEEPVVREPVEDENPNPLDNTYAVQFEIGDQVTLAYSNGTKENGLTGSIEGYDKEGFYRVKWSDGSTTNGFTDIALSGLATRVKESVCICGGKKFVTEGKSLICDDCGRRVGASARRKSEKIRGEHIPVSTSMEEAILSAFKR